MTRAQAGVTTVIVWLSGCSTAGNETSSTDSTSDETSQTTGSTTSATGTAATASSTGGAISPSSTSTTTSPTRPNTTSQEPVATTSNEVSPDTSDVASNTNAPTDATESQPSGGASTAANGTTEATTSAVNSSEQNGGEITSAPQTEEPPGDDVVDVGADAKFSFFVTSYYHLALLSGNEAGFGGDLRYNGAATGLEGADAICQEIGRRVSFGHRTWRAYLSTSSVNAIDRIGEGPWYDFVGAAVADSKAALASGGNRFPGGCCEEGTYDEMGMYHDGSTDQNNDGMDDDDHDTMTATQEDGTYAGFSCEDWTSTTATAPAGGGGQGGGQGGGGQGGGGGPGFGGGIMMGHTWPAQSGQHWATSHGGHNCAAGTNFIQNGPGDSATVGGGGGYGGFYCFALPE